MNTFLSISLIFSLGYVLYLREKRKRAVEELFAHFAFQSRRIKDLDSYEMKDLICTLKLAKEDHGFNSSIVNRANGSLSFLRGRYEQAGKTIDF